MIDRPVEAAMAAFILVAVAFTFGLLIVNARAESRCLAIGYPGSSVDWRLSAYCIKRVDQTDVVIKLSDAEPK